MLFVPVFTCYLIFSSYLRIGAHPRTSIGNRKIVTCTCPPGGSVSKDFILQPEFDVCSIACTSGNQFAAKAPEAETIAKGYSIMQHTTVEICILCRDAVDLLPNLTRRIRTLSGKFEKTHLSVIENDSKDDTVEEFRRWARNEKEHGNSNLLIDIEHHNLLLERPPVADAGYDDMEYASQRATRYHRLSLLRNRCLFQVIKRPLVDFLIVLDVDRDVDDEVGDYDGIAHSFGLSANSDDSSWDVICANSVLKQPPGVSASLYRNISENVLPHAKDWVYRDSLAFRDTFFDLDTFRFHEKRIHTPYDSPYFVESCFGGLAMYKLHGQGEQWHRCSYEAFMDDDCEHVSFHSCLRNFGWKIMFNPRMTVRYR